MADLVPPAPVAIPDQSDFQWQEWYKNLRNRANLPIVDGNIVLDTSIYIKGGQTDYNTGTGFFLGYSGGDYKLSIGNSSIGPTILWDGSTFSVNGGTLIGSTIKTASSGRRIEMTSVGITLYTGLSPGTYGNFLYGAKLYGATDLAYINNTGFSIPFYINAEQTVADIHLFNRSSDPSGVAAVGDIACVNGKLKICTVAGTPGTWTVVGTQS